MRWASRATAIMAATAGAIGLVASPASATTYEFRIAYKTQVTSWGVTYTFVHAGQTGTFLGTILPAASGKQSRLQQSTDGGATWTSVVATTTDAAGHVSGNVKPASSRDYSWALVPDAQTSPSRSKTIRLTVVAALATYPNCTELNKRYPHGVGRPNASDSTTGTPVRTFLPDTAEYGLNDGGTGQSDLDRDNDGIACEKA